jgi:hypothetical protein
MGTVATSQSTATRDEPGQTKGIARYPMPESNGGLGKILEDVKVSFGEKATGIRLPWVRSVQSSSALAKLTDEIKSRPGITVLEAGITSRVTPALTLLESAGPVVRMSFDERDRASGPASGISTLVPQTNAFCRLISMADMVTPFRGDAGGSDRSTFQRQKLAKKPEPVSLLDVLASETGIARARLEKMREAASEQENHLLLLHAHFLYSAKLAAESANLDDGPNVLISTGEALVLDNSQDSAGVALPRKKGLPSGNSSGVSEALHLTRQRCRELFADVRAQCAIHVRASGIDVLRNGPTGEEWCYVERSTGDARRHKNEMKQESALHEVCVAECLYTKVTGATPAATCAKKTKPSYAFLRKEFGDWCRAIRIVDSVLSAAHVKYRIEAFPMSAVANEWAVAVGIYTKGTPEVTTAMYGAIYDEFDNRELPNAIDVMPVESLGDDIGVHTLTHDEVCRLGAMLVG